MLKLWNRKNKSKKEEITEDPVAAEQEKEKELELLCRMDTEARQQLKGDYLERYLIAKELGLELQAEIARIEGVTNTVLCDPREQRQILRKKIALNLGYSVGGDHYNYPDISFDEKYVAHFPGKMNRGAMLRFQELRNFFDEMIICYPNIGVDPFMYGVKNWQGKKLHFLIMTWE